MRYYAAIPFGGNSITRDIKTECNFSFELAENIKRAYGACMPSKLSAMGEKSIQIVDENDEPTAQVTVKYISEIISARMKEIIEALLYHIQASGYASEDLLRAGVVVTGGGAEIVNCANYIKDLSGYSVKIGYPRRFFSCEGCPEAGEASAATSMGMIMAAKGDKMLNCVNEAPARRYWTAPKPASRPTAVEDLPTEVTQTEVAVNETVEAPEETEVVTEPAIEAAVIAAQDEGGSTVFDEPTEEEVREYEQRKADKGNKPPKPPRKPRTKPKFTWFKHIQSTISKAAGDIFDDMENEEI